jgi:hypothetical protein
MKRYLIALAVISLSANAQTFDPTQHDKGRWIALRKVSDLLPPQSNQREVCGVYERTVDPTASEPLQGHSVTWASTTLPQTPPWETKALNDHSNPVTSDWVPFTLKPNPKVASASASSSSSWNSDTNVTETTSETSVTINGKTYTSFKHFEQNGPMTREVETVIFCR